MDPRERLKAMFMIDCRLRVSPGWGVFVACFQMRAEFGHRLGDPCWTRFIEQLCAAGPRFAEMWARHEVASSETRRKSFWTVDGERLSLIASGFAAASAPDTKLWVYTPDAAAERTGRPLPGYRRRRVARARHSQRWWPTVGRRSGFQARFR
ncbi:hypothetical protein ACIBHX_31655 [Nonomuraea sp. NPDC050536]|uniref:MmyB family transcriptional regulator n=1 Tax=Nonomuraea sp. NPDC050536 TaxID=3364366 RepID=UPI0037C59E7F